MSKNKDGKPDNQELQELRQWLISQGVKPADAAQLVKENRTRGEITTELRGWLKDRPKGKAK